MDTRESTFKLAFKPALIISAVSIAISLVLWAVISDIETRQKFDYLTWLVVAFLYYYFTKDYRENSLGGTITYGKSFSFMFLITLVISVITMVYMYILVTAIDPGMIDMIKDQAATKLYEQNSLNEEQIEQAIEMQGLWITPTVITISGFFGSVFFGTLLSLVLSIFVKNDAQIIEE